MNSTPLTHGRMLALFAPVFWSISGITIRLMEHPNEWQINFYRSGWLVLFVLVMLALRYRGRFWRPIAASGSIGLISGFFLGLSMFANIVALNHTTVANATLLMAASPIVAAVFGRMWLNERVSTMTWAAIAITFIGIAIMVGGSVIVGSIVGDVVALIGMFGFGAYAISLRLGTKVDMTPAVLYGGLFSSSIAGLIAMATGVGLKMSLYDFALCTVLGVFQIGIGSVLFALASRVVPAAELTLFALAEPVLAPLWTWLGVGEVPVTATFIGGGLILTALLLQTTVRLPR